MQQTPVHPTGLSYSQAMAVTDARRWVFVSGQVPENEAGHVPADFGEQCRLVWKNIGLQLEAAGMSLNNLVKITVFLGHRRYREENKQVRMEVLGNHSPALTVIITGIYDEKWLLEIEGIAAGH